MYTSPSSAPSGWGNANAMTSVRPRRPVARRLRRRMAAASSRVSSTRECGGGAPSQARTRPTTRSSPGRGLPRRRDAATGLRIIDAVVVHPGDDADELLLDLVDLSQRHRRLIELPGVQLGAHDVVD